MEIEARLNRVAGLFRREQDSRNGKRVSKYPDALWDEVAILIRAGAPSRDVCERCRIKSGTLSQGLGRVQGRKLRQPRPRTSFLQSSSDVRAVAIKTLDVEPPPQTPVRAPSSLEIVFPNGIRVHLCVSSFDDALVARLKAC